MGYPYSCQEKLKFGMYKGYTLEMIYVVDPNYVEWCLNKVEFFCITEKTLSELQNLGTVVGNLDWQQRLLRSPKLIPELDLIENNPELFEKIKMESPKFSFKETTLQNNKRKLNSHYST